MIVVLVLQGVALVLQDAPGAVALVAAATIAAAGLAIAAFSAVLGARTLVVAPGRSDVASAGMSTAFNVGITAGALIGSLLLGTAGVRSTALVGAVLTLAALAVVLAEPLVASAARRRPLRAVPCPAAASPVRGPEAVTARRADAA
jgi:predicted MFS family arabinose efflux permease